MAGLLIYSSYGLFYSSIINDNDIYEATKKEFSSKPNKGIHFARGNLLLDQLDNSREKVVGIVKNLNQGQVNLSNMKKEISIFFD